MGWIVDESRILREYTHNAMAGTAPSLTGDQLMVALYNDTVTPSVDDASGFGLGAFSSGEVIHGDAATEPNMWDAGGVALTGRSLDKSDGGLVTLRAATTVSGDATDLSNVHGDLVYVDDSAGANTMQGVAFHSFGGTQSVTNGTFSIIWDQDGVLYFDVEPDAA